MSTANTESSSSDAFKQITDKMHETYKAKNADYGNSFDKSMDEFGITAAVVRMSDKEIRKMAITFVANCEDSEGKEYPEYVKKNMIKSYMAGYRHI